MQKHLDLDIKRYIQSFQGETKKNSEVKISRYKLQNDQHTNFNLKSVNREIRETPAYI